MNRIVVRTALAVGLFTLAGQTRPVLAQRQVAPKTTHAPLVTGRDIAAPPAEGNQPVGNLPMNLAATPDRRLAIASDMGYRQALWVLDLKSGKVLSHLNFPNKPNDAKANKKSASAIPAGETVPAPAAPAVEKTNGLYYGMAISKDNTIYAAQGGNDSIAVLSIDDHNMLHEKDRITTRKKDFPSGVALDNNNRLYVANNASGEGNPFDFPGSVAIYDLTTKKELGRFTFSASHGGTSNFPFGIAVLPDGTKAYVAAERDDCVYVLDTHDPTKPILAATVPTGAHPVAVLLSKNQQQLFVANSLGDTISIIDTATNRVANTILLRPPMARDLPGATPTALALSPDGKTLYVTLGDMNAVAVIDVAKAEVSGYIAAGWYPSALVVSADGKKLLVANAKGDKVRNPNNVPDPHDPARKTGYILSILDGSVSQIDVPGGDELKESTDQVLKLNRLDALSKSANNPLAEIGLAAEKIKHVIYIIKENRTYDEVLGDLPQGDGLPSLVLFGRDVTPNQHALAERFVLLDNLYASGEVSGDGWVWSTQGMANAYVIRNVPYSYSGRGRVFDFEGANNGYPTGGLPDKDEQGKPLANVPRFKAGLPAIPDVASTGRNLWDATKEAGVSLRNYGFYVYSGDGHIGLVDGPDNYPNSAGLQPGGHDLAGITDIDFRRFDMDYADSDAPSTYFKQTGDAACLYSTKSYGVKEAPSRFSEWNREFQLMLAKDSSGGAVPGLMMVRFPMDHTVGARSGKHTPKSYIADNDYAVGHLVEAVSHSPIWNSTAIFVIEDDAQAGADHVDAHRTIGFVISPWIKAHSVDHRFYNTDSMLKTLELILGLKPLCQYDAVADPILDWDTSPSNAEPYQAIVPPKALIAETNPKAQDLGLVDPRWKMATSSDRMDFTHADAVPSRELNEIVWKTVKGVQSEMPPRRGMASKDDDDD